MSEENLLRVQRLQRVVREQLGVREEEVQLTTSFVNDLGADSLDLVEIVIAIEEEFEIEIPDEHAERFDTIQSVLDYLNAALPKQVAA